MMIEQLADNEYEKWIKSNKFDRFWNGDASLWTNNDENRWVGWLKLPILTDHDFDKIRLISADLKKIGCKYIVLLGMGGSSLCPDMMANIFNQQASIYPKLFVLDSTDPTQILALEQKIDLKQSFFIVSSKSGNTLETAFLKTHFYEKLQKIYGKNNVGNYFLAITDPGSTLDIQAKAEHFKATFYGLSSIGGRYSALSHFGMVPAGLSGVDIKTLLKNAQKTYEQFKHSNSHHQNPAIQLGILLGVCAGQGKNKLTLILSPQIQSLGAWLEQLIAESTGKSSKAIIPIDGEPLGEVESYSLDRVFVSITIPPSSNEEKAQHQTIEKKLHQLEQAGQIIIRLKMPDIMHISVEMYRWEIATAVASSIMGVNPFNQPDVESTKKRTSEIMRLNNKLTQSDSKIASENIYSSKHLTIYAYTNATLKSHDLLAILKAFITLLQPEDYFNISAFIEMSEQNSEILQDIRILIRNYIKVATCLGFGPRFLHSTGQAHKGGPNTGLFLQITTDYPDEHKIPILNTSFANVISAQAQADLDVLVNLSRRVMRVHIHGNVYEGLVELRNIIENIVSK